MAKRIVLAVTPIPILPLPHAVVVPTCPEVDPPDPPPLAPGIVVVLPGTFVVPPGTCVALLPGTGLAWPFVGGALLLLLPGEADATGSPLAVTPSLAVGVLVVEQAAKTAIVITSEAVRRVAN